MPNWCSNNLHMEGDAEEIKRFEDTHNSVPKTWGEDKPSEDKTKLDFSASVWDEGNGGKEYSGYGYDWQIKHWGTKWNACDVEHQDDGYYSFETAWGPPEAWVRYMSTKYSKLKFVLSYSEPGMGFMGILVVQKGIKLFDKCIDYDEARDIIKQNLDPSEEKKLKDLEEDDRWDFYDEHMHKAWEMLEDEANVN